MKIILGSRNKAKLKAVKHVFKEFLVEDIDAPSQVSDQPTTDEEALHGAFNRASYCYKINPNDISIGLEGGVMLVDDDLYLCSWGVLMSERTDVIKAGGARIQLPNHFKRELFKGIELSTLIDHYSQKHNTREHEGAIGIFTEGEIDRKKMFEHIVLMLKGQYEHALYKLN